MSPGGKFIRRLLHDLEVNKSDSIHLFEQLVLAVGQAGDLLVKYDAYGLIPTEDVVKKFVTIASLSARLATEGTAEYAFPTEPNE
jgi:hypothetical protein